MNVIAFICKTISLELTRNKQMVIIIHAINIERNFNRNFYFGVKKAEIKRKKSFVSRENLKFFVDTGAEAF